MPYAEAITALADPTRREIFEALRGRARTVGELAQGRRVSRPAVSQHLKALGQAGLVRVTPEGTRRFYSIEREGLADLRRYLEQFWDDALDAYAAEVRRRVPPKPTRRRRRH